MAAATAPQSTVGHLPICSPDSEDPSRLGYTGTGSQPNRATAHRAIFTWINRYNRARLDSSLGYVPPIEWEDHYRQAQADLAA